jgi:hypothetical protein
MILDSTADNLSFLSWAPLIPNQFTNKFNFTLNFMHFADLLLILSIHEVHVRCMWLNKVLSASCKLGMHTYKPQVKISSRTCIHALSRALRLRTSRSLLRWAPMLPRVLGLRTPPPDWGGLQRCHMSYGFGPRLLAEVGSSTTTCPTALDRPSLLRWAPVLPHVSWLRILPPY